MKPERLLELLAYAKVCFEKCTNPFETVHLAKLKVTAEECRELSVDIASIIEDEVLAIAASKRSNAFTVLKQAEERFAETQT